MYGQIAYLNRLAQPGLAGPFLPSVNETPVVVLSDAGHERLTIGEHEAKVRIAMIVPMDPLISNPVFHIPLSSPNFPSCSPIFDPGLDLTIPPALWPTCFIFKHWCSVRFDSIHEVPTSSLTFIRFPTPSGAGEPLALRRADAQRLGERVRERQRLQEKRARAARRHLESFGFLESLEEEGEEGSTAAKAGQAESDGDVRAEDGDGDEGGCFGGPSPGPGLGPSRVVMRACGNVDADARSVLSSRNSVSFSSDADTLVDKEREKEKDRMSSKWSLGSVFAGGSRRSSVISTEEVGSTSTCIELPDWKQKG